MEPTNKHQLVENVHDLSWIISRLALSRQTLDEKKDELARKRAAFDLENAQLIADIKAAQEDNDKYYRVACDFGAAEYETFGTKKPHPAIEIKIVETPLFNAPEAEDWARRNMPGLFVFDGKAYGKMLRVYHESKTLAAVLPTMPGEMIAEAKAYVSADLSEYVPAPVTPASDTPDGVK